MIADPFEIVDPILLPWAKRYGIHIQMKDRDWAVRLITVFDSRGNPRAQLGLSVPKIDEITIFIAERDGTDLAAWHRMERTVKIADVEDTIEEFRARTFANIGPGAFA